MSAQTYAETAGHIDAALDAGHGLTVKLGDGFRGYMLPSELAEEWWNLAPGEAFDVTPCALCAAEEPQTHKYAPTTNGRHA